MSSSPSGCSIRSRSNASSRDKCFASANPYAVLASTCNGMSPYLSRAAATASTSQPGSILSLIRTYLVEVSADVVEELRDAVEDADRHLGGHLIHDGSEMLSERLPACSEPRHRESPFPALLDIRWPLIGARRPAASSACRSSFANSGGARNRRMTSTDAALYSGVQRLGTGDALPQPSL